MTPLRSIDQTETTPVKYMCLKLVKREKLQLPASYYNRSTKTLILQDMFYHKFLKAFAKNGIYENMENNLLMHLWTKTEMVLTNMNGLGETFVRYTNNRYKLPQGR